MFLIKKSILFMVLALPALSYGKVSLLKTLKDSKIKAVCYERVYSDSEVGSSNSTYPEKIVKNIKAQFDLSQSETVLSLTALLLDDKTDNSNVNLNMICEDNTAGDELTHCATANGEMVIVEALDNGQTLKLTNESISNLSKQNRSRLEIFRMNQVNCYEN